MNLFERGAARLVRTTVIVDRAQRVFDRVRSTLVARFATDSFLEAYNDLAYQAESFYDVGSVQFRAGLFHWEEEMASRHFPRPPARMLLGGAGGGREVYAWASQGYAIVAFEPAIELARSMAAQRGRYPGVQVLKGKYEDLPTLEDLESGAGVDLGTLGPFDVVVLGWPTYSHLRTRARRVGLLRQMGGLTDGPIALSFFLDKQRDTRPTGRLQRLVRRLGVARPGDAFSPHIGFHHWSTEAEITDETREAGLRVVDASWDDRDGRWPWMVVRREVSG